MSEFLQLQSCASTPSVVFCILLWVLYLDWDWGLYFTPQAVLIGLGYKRAVFPGMGLLRAVLQLCWEIRRGQMEPGPGLWAALWGLLFWWHNGCNTRGQSSWIRWINVGAMGYEGWFTKVSNAAVDSVSSFIGKKLCIKLMVLVIKTHWIQMLWVLCLVYWLRTKKSVSQPLHLFPLPALVLVLSFTAVSTLQWGLSWSGCLCQCS